MATKEKPGFLTAFANVPRGLPRLPFIPPGLSLRWESQQLPLLGCCSAWCFSIAEMGHIFYLFFQVPTTKGIERGPSVFCLTSVGGWKVLTPRALIIYSALPSGTGTL